MNQLLAEDLKWAVQRLPGALRTVIEQAPPGAIFIAGGYVRSMVSGEPVNDIDCFCKSKPEALHYLQKVRVSWAHKKTINDHFIETANAYTLVGEKGTTIQFIHRWTFRHVEECVESFDFTIAKAAIYYFTGKDGAGFTQPMWVSCVDPRFYPDLAAKRLVYTSPQRNEEEDHLELASLLDAGGSMLRVLKFYQRGYRIPLDSMGAVIARLIKGFKPEDWKELEGHPDSEGAFADIVTALLREVDPEIDPTHRAHLPSGSEKK